MYDSQLKTIRDAIPLKIAETIEEINELQAKIFSFNEELKSFLEVYEDGELENAFEKLTIFSNKKREYSKQLHYFKTLKFIVSAKYVVLFLRILNVAR